jgi:hypothetical protein
MNEMICNNMEGRLSMLGTTATFMMVLVPTYPTVNKLIVTKMQQRKTHCSLQLDFLLTVL